MRTLIATAVLALCFVAVYAGKRCDNSKDCAKDECCLSKSFLPISLRRGECTKLTKLGDKCSEKGKTVGFSRKLYMFHCPCQPGLKCKGTGDDEDSGNDDDNFFLPIIGGKKKDMKCKPGTETTSGEDGGITLPVTVPTLPGGGDGDGGEGGQE